MLDLKRVLGAKPKDKPIEALTPLSTVWGEEILSQTRNPETGTPKLDATFVPRSEHPHPQFMRDSYVCLNGWWNCAFAPLIYEPKEDTQDLLASLEIREDISTPILVPFSPEADLSGVGRRLGYDEVLWYQREVTIPQFKSDERCILHFEAVDDTCAVWCNGTLLGTHSGGYLPFHFDITDCVAPEGITDKLADNNGANEMTIQLTLAITDPSEYGVQLRGKQKINRSDLWYTAQSGIWQPVWYEIVPDAFIEELVVTPSTTQDLCTATMSITAKTSCAGMLTAEVFDKGELRMSGTAPINDNNAVLHFGFENVHLWSPEDPYIYEVRYTFGNDVVRSYVAFRKLDVAEAKDGAMRFLLNDKPYFVKGVLDQGYWPESHMTAPADEAFVFDIKAMKEVGFNMCRKHIKIEADRWYYYCDTLGMLVWQDMVSGGGIYDEMQTMYIPTLFTRSWTHYADTTPKHQKKLGSDNLRYQEIWKHTLDGAIAYLRNHPCISTWILFNEGWGQFDTVENTAHARSLDATRQTHSVSGWFDQHVGDYFAVHNYFRDAEVFKDKHGDNALSNPTDACRCKKRACVTDEFGGYVCNVADHAQQSRSFGYAVYRDIPSLREAVRELLYKMDALEQHGLAGYVYTQLSDIEEETNGVLTYDRKVNKLASFQGNTD